LRDAARVRCRRRPPRDGDRQEAARRPAALDPPDPDRTSDRGRRRHRSRAAARPGGHRRMTRVAYQGEPGAFGEEAVIAWFGPQVDAVPVATFSAVRAAVEA